MSTKFRVREIEKANGNVILRFEKLNHNHSGDPGTPLYGWTNTNHTTTFINYLRGLEMPRFPNYQKRGYNPECLILYDEDKIIGWVNDAVTDDVEDYLWDYLLGRVSPEKENNKSPQEKEKTIELRPLTLF